MLPKNICGAVLNFIPSHQITNQILSVKRSSIAAKETMAEHYRTKADSFRQINWNFPQFSKEARGLLALRTTIEREISWLKRDLKMESLWKRGKKNVIAHVAKCLISMHLVTNVAHKVGCPECAYRIKTFAK
ncbi:hypothetical protein LR013_02975 [candidate division NPL-UPA2 bacterium]|nr:hypothetical protein [candidate division NPL-UPA2 bacterium]